MLTTGAELMAQPLPVIAPGLAILHVDDELIVLNKPAGLLCVPGRGPGKQDCLATRAAELYPGALVVHRLDMATSGLVVMARTSLVQRYLSAAFAQRRVSKRYTAIVAGKLPTLRGLINAPIAVDWPRRPLRHIDPEFGKPSLTRWRVLDVHAYPEQALVELEPETGRTHQLRLHMASIGTPILGDLLYGHDDVMAPGGRLYLHATELTFPRPSGGTVNFHCPPPFVRMCSGNPVQWPM